MNQYLLAIVSGLTNGGISCSVIQGGLLATAVTDEKLKFENTYKFLLSKIIVHTFLGALLGALGSLFIVSIKIQGIIQILIGLFMIISALRLLNINSIFKIVEIKTPKFITKKLENYYLKFPKIRPLILGASTVLIPCGTTQAMFVLSVGSGNALSGALIMFLFVLGTTPIFLALGLTIGSIIKQNLLKYVAFLSILFLGLLSINNGQVLRNSPHTFQNYTRVIFGQRIFNPLYGPNIQDGKQIVYITATNTAYKSNIKSIKVDVPVRLIITSDKLFSCASKFVIPSLNINEALPAKGQKVIDFIPKDLGTLIYSCGMGMYTGSFEVTE